MPGHGQRVPEDERRVHPATIGGLANVQLCPKLKAGFPSMERSV